jgi:Fe-S cluster assembly protein SufD
VVVRIAPGTLVEGPVVVVNASDGDKVAAFPHVVVDAGAGSEATVVEWATSGGAHLYVDPVTELHVGDTANLRHVLLQDLGAATWQTGHLLATVGRDATLRCWLLSIGGDYARTYVAATLPAQGSTAKVAGVYFGDERQLHDIRSVQDHIGTRSVSDFQLKGAVVDEARGVYTGLIRVREGAKATESFLANRNLVLSEGAHVDSVPNLEIVNENDIRSCGHAAATGPVDEEHLFYLESRGIPTEQAEQLIVYGFFDEIVAEVPVAEVRDHVRAAVARKLAKVVEVGKVGKVGKAAEAGGA